MKYRIKNLTGMRLRYLGIKFEPNESKVLDLDTPSEHEYFKIEKLRKKSKKKKNSTKLNEELEKQEKKLNK